MSEPGILLNNSFKSMPDSGIPLETSKNDGRWRLEEDLERGRHIRMDLHSGGLPRDYLGNTRVENRSI